MTVLRWLGWAFLRLTLAARYRLLVHGRERLGALKGPVLVLPNHPGYIDPFLLFAVLWPSLRMRPLVYRGTFQGLTGRFLVRLVNALEVPDLDVASVRAAPRRNRPSPPSPPAWHAASASSSGQPAASGATASSASDPPAPPPTSSARPPTATSCWCGRAASGVRRGPGRSWGRGRRWSGSCSPAWAGSSPIC